MFLGHYGVALAARRIAPRASLAVFFVAAQFLDMLWPLLLIADVEHVRIVPGLMAASPLDFVHYPYSHSLLMATVWGGLTGLVWFGLRRYGRTAWILAALVVSHWFLDVPMHRPDLPLWPGSTIMAGFGLWQSVPLTLVLEFGMLTSGLLLYLRSTRATNRVGSWGLWALVAALAVGFLGSLASAPPNETALAWGALTLWLFVPWAWWVDRHRRPIVN